MNRLAVLTAAALAATAPAFAAETVVTLDGGLDATNNIPDGATGAPAVVMLHGTGSQKDEVGNMYAREAKALADKGVASIRLSFRGFGKSDGDMGATTVESMVEDALVATRYIQSQQGVAKDRIGALGFSLGGVALVAAGKNPDLYKSVATWSSVGDFVKDYTREPEGKARMDRAMAEGVVGFDLGWRTMVLKKGFYESLIANDIPAIAANYKGALLMIAGAKDFSAAYPEAFVGKSTAERKKATIVPEGDHIFGVLGPDQAQADAVITETADWFADTL